jgi:beta-galactosidase
LKGVSPSLDSFGEATRTDGNLPATAFSHAPEVRLSFSFDEDWQFFRPLQDASAPTPHAVSQGDAPFPADAEWEPATLPHSVRLEPQDVSGCRNYQGICWYQKHFNLNANWKDQVLYLTFQGAMQVADLWMNGKHLTTHYGGYLPFTVDISNAVNFGRDNVLLVRLDNSDNPEVPPGKPQSELDFVYFGGLYRSVQFQVLNPLHITDPILADKAAGGGIFVTFPKVGADESTVEMHTDLANESHERRTCTVTQELIDRNGNAVAVSRQNATIEARGSQAVAQSMRVRNARLWHPDDPQLYWLHTSISENGQVTDDQYTRIGIRSIHFERDRGLLINGQPFFSIGANRHQDHPYVGYALPPSVHYRDAYKLREAGFTSYRSHYPQDPSFMDACDELGILAIVSNPGWQFVGDELFKKRACQDAREMIRRDRNRPSVAIWEAALNESDNSSIAAELYRIVHEEFPGPDCYSAGDPIPEPVEGFNGWDIGYVPHEKDDRSKPSWIREWGDQVDNWSDQQGRVRVAREWGETPMLVQAFGHMLSLDRIYSSRAMPAGANLWAGIDAYRGYHHQPFLGAPLDLFRLPKFDYFMFQSQRPPERKPAAAGSGPMVFIANFASFHSPSQVTVFSNCEAVRLYQNGKEVATQRPDSGYRIPHPPFTFKVGDFSSTHTMLFSNGVAPSGTEIGELRAEGLIGGEVVARHLIHSPGEPKQIQLKLDACGRDPIANGADWVRVYAHICDARGTTYPYGDDWVTFSVSGQGSLIGDEKISANPVRAEAGIATGLVRTTYVAGQVSVCASSPGLKKAVLQFDSKADLKAVMREA